jgi:putative ABC transport system permease protein
MRIETLHDDLRLAWCGLRRAKSFSIAAILTLGLGMTGTTVMFTVIRGVLLRPLPVREQGRLIVAWKELRSSGFAHYPFGDAEIEEVGNASQLLEAVAGVDANGVGRQAVTEDGTSSYVKSALITGRYLEVLGVDAILGRALTAADDVDGAENVTVISHALWRGRYGGSRDVIGRRVTLGEQRFTIVGVMPPDVDYPSGVEMWRLTRSVPTNGPFGNAARREIDLIARLRPGVSVEQATSELAALTRRLESAVSPTADRGLTPVVHTFEEAVVGNVRPAMVALMAAVGLVLLIASANVANLLLMRGEARRAELAVREALGAARGRIVRQLLGESLVLTLVAGVVAVLATWWSLHALLTIVPEGLPRVESIRIDATVVLFTLIIALVTSCVAGVAPALSSASSDLLSQLQGGGRGAAGRASSRGRRALMVAQVALAVTVVCGAGLLARSVLRLQAIETGFDADRLVLVELSLPPTKYDDRARHAQLLDAAIARLESVPAIAGATPVNTGPFSGDGGWDVPRFTAEGQTAERAAANPSLNLESVHPNYFATLDVPLVSGRAFVPSDREGSLRVAIVSEEVAALTWPGQDPIGKRIRMGGPQSREEWLTVVGVSASTRYRELERPRPTIYLPAAQFLVTAEKFVLRSAAPLDVVSSIVRDRMSTVDRDVRVMRVVPFARLLDGPLARPRFNAFVLTIFAVAAVLLTTVGLYAVMGAYVRQRDREIAVRIAVGATAANVRRLVLGEAVWLAALGAAIGLAGAAGTTRVLRGMLYQVDTLDPATLFGAALALVAASALASYVPMRRAVRLDAVAMLRN